MNEISNIPSGLPVLDRLQSNLIERDPLDGVTDFVGDLRARGAAPHIAVNATVSKHRLVRKTAIDTATRQRDGYAISQGGRKRIEEIFGACRV